MLTQHIAWIVHQFGDDVGQVLDDDDGERYSDKADEDRKHSPGFCHRIDVAVANSGDRGKYLKEQRVKNELLTEFILKLQRVTTGKQCRQYRLGSANNRYWWLSASLRGD